MHLENSALYSISVVMAVRLLLMTMIKLNTVQRSSSGLSRIYSLSFLQELASVKTLPMTFYAAYDIVSDSTVAYNTALLRVRIHVQCFAILPLDR